MDYELLYKELQSRCHAVAENLRMWFADKSLPGDYLLEQCDLLDTPIATQDAAERLHLGDRP